MQVPASGALTGAARSDTSTRSVSRLRAGYGSVVVFACVLTFVVISWGGLGRATGAGLACPDWPLCNGVLHPSRDPLVLYEWGHRFVAGVLGFVILYVAAG